MLTTPVTALPKTFSKASESKKMPSTNDDDWGVDASNWDDESDGDDAPEDDDDEIAKLLEERESRAKQEPSESMSTTRVNAEYSSASDQVKADAKDASPSAESTTETQQQDQEDKARIAAYYITVIEVCMHREPLPHQLNIDSSRSRRKSQTYFRTSNSCWRHTSAQVALFQKVNCALRYVISDDF